MSQQQAEEQKQEEVIQNNLSDQNTDEENSIDDIEYEQVFPGLHYIVKILDDSQKVVYEQSQKNNSIFQVNIKDIQLEIDCKPPSKGHIKFYKEDWENAMEQVVGVYCHIKNNTENTDRTIELEMFDKPNNDSIKKENIGKNQRFVVDSICDNDYQTREWEQIFLHFGSNKYTIETQIKNPFHNDEEEQ